MLTSGKLPGGPACEQEGQFFNKSSVEDAAMGTASLAIKALHRVCVYAIDYTGCEHISIHTALT